MTASVNIDRRFVLLSASAVGAGTLLTHRAALAHAQLHRATPPVGGNVATAPTEVMLEFTQSIEPRFSSIVVRDAAGRQVDQGNARAGNNDPRRFLVDLSNLSPGTYKVVWSVMSVDTHRSEGSFNFTFQS